MKLLEHIITMTGMREPKVAFTHLVLLKELFQSILCSHLLITIEVMQVNMKSCGLTDNSFTGQFW